MHVFLPIFASFFTCMTAILCVKETTTLTQPKITKKSSTGTPRCLKQVRSAPCGRIELGHVKQVNPSTKRHIKTSEKTIQDSQRPEKPDLE